MDFIHSTERDYIVSLRMIINRNKLQNHHHNAHNYTISIQIQLAQHFPSCMYPYSSTIFLYKNKACIMGINYIAACLEAVHGLTVD